MNKRFFKNDFDLSIFKESALMIVASVVSLLLEVISFFTTLDGARAYFAQTFSLAPLFFALAVQSVVYFLENGIRRRVTPAKAMALAAAIVCSSYFSFVGIYNNINPPEAYLEKTYKTYSEQLRSALSELEAAADSGANTAVNTAVNGIIKEYTALTAEKETLAALSEQISAARAEDSYSMTAPRRGDYEEYEDYAAAYSAYIAGLSQSGTAEQQAKIEALLLKYGISDSADITERTAEISARLSLIGGTFGAYDSAAFYAKAEQVRGSILSGADRQLAERVFALYGDLSGKAARVPEELFAGETELYLPDFSEIDGGGSAAALREKLGSLVSDACDKVRAAGAEIVPDDYLFENIYTLPLYAVISGSFGADAVISLLLAVLVDMLSLLFAMIAVRRRSVLSAADTKSAYDMSEGLFEQNIVTALQIGVCADGESFAGKWDSAVITERLAEFAGLFRAADFAADRGFSMIAERSDIDSRFEALTAFLCQFGLAKIISAKDAELLTGGEVTVPCVLLKTKFLLWISEKFCAPDNIADPGGERSVIA